MTKTFGDLNQYPKPGQLVRILELRPTTGFICGPKVMQYRQSNVDAVAISHVPGHGGDVWVLQHGDGTQAVYSIDEFMEREG